MTREFAIIGTGIGICGRVYGCEMSPNKILEGLDAVEFPYTHYHMHRYAGARNDIPALREYFTKVATLTRKSIERARFPLMLGGDHACAIGTWSGISTALQNKGDDLALIWIDAHMDSHQPETSDTSNIHGMPVAHLMGYGYPELVSLLHANPKLKPENLVFIGIRSYEPAEEELLNSLGVKIYYQRDLTPENTTKIIVDEYTRLAKKTGYVGISLDLDGLDPQDIIAVGTPEENGIEPSNFFNALEQIDFNKLVGFEIAEYNPKLDRNLSSLNFIVKLVQKLKTRLEQDESKH